MGEPQTEEKSAPTIEEVCEALTETGKKRLLHSIVRMPCHTLRASSIGHPCDRFLYYSQANWEDRALHDEYLQGIFEEGNEHEKIVLKDLMQDCFDNGWFLVGQQQHFHDKRYNISGHIDAAISTGSQTYPVEIKSSAPWIWDTIRTEQDLREHKMLHVRNYFAQMQTYLFLHAVEVGVIVFKNKQNGLRRFVPVSLDLGFMETILKKAERIKSALEMQVVPDRSLDLDICPQCPFKAICQPALDDALPRYDETALLLALESKDDFKEAHQMYESANKVAKAIIDRHTETKFMAGPYLITRTWTPEKEVPAKTRSGYWTNRAEKVDEI